MSIGRVRGSKSLPRGFGVMPLQPKKKATECLFLLSFGSSNTPTLLAWFYDEYFLDMHV